MLEPSSTLKAKAHGRTLGKVVDVGPVARYDIGTNLACLSTRIIIVSYQVAPKQEAKSRDDHPDQEGGSKKEQTESAIVC